ncbi:MAG TPA: YaeQ family protein [Burkholderiales bacterium]|nr:YaeQ family protein [Burkholderiales bacterium]
MALGATIHHFAVQLSDADRSAYESLDFKAARHPSETAEALVSRVLAYCLEYTEGIAFSRGLAEPDEPPILVRDLTGALKSWIEVGAPDAARLHKAAKSAPRVAVYTARPDRLRQKLAGEKIHRADALELYAVDRNLLDALVKHLERRMSFDLSVTGGHVFVSLGDQTLDGAVERFTLQ